MWDNILFLSLSLTVLPFVVDCILACGNCGFFCGSFRTVLLVFSIFFPQMTLLRSSFTHVHLGALLKHRARIREVLGLYSAAAKHRKVG